jgi:heme/copper-type cytochrome/quinol oxidase subunit 1
MIRQTLQLLGAALMITGTLVMMSPAAWWFIHPDLTQMQVFRAIGWRALILALVLLGAGYTLIGGPDDRDA